MSDSIALSPEQFIFAQGEELKTTSLKIAERFKKDHGNVLKAIDNILTQVSDSFREVNFNFSEYEQENKLGLMVKYRFCEMTRDGFMILVMSFTGKEAMQVKEWYINAFNQMQAKLFPTTPYAPKSLPQEPLRKTTKALPGCLSLETQDEIKQLINDRAATQPREQQAGFVISMWSALGTHFGIKKDKGDKIPAYKHIPEGARLECLSLLARLSSDNLVTLTHTQLEEKINGRLKALPAPAPLEGDVMPKPQANSVTLTFNPDTDQRLLVTQGASGMIVINPLPNAYYYLGDKARVMADLTADGVVCFNKDDVPIRKLVNEYIPHQHLPQLIESAAQRLQAINKGKPAA